MNKKEFLLYSTIQEYFINNETTWFEGHRGDEIYAIIKEKNKLANNKITLE